MQAGANLSSGECLNRRSNLYYSPRNGRLFIFSMPSSQSSLEPYVSMDMITSAGRIFSPSAAAAADYKTGGSHKTKLHDVCSLQYGRQHELILRSDHGPRSTIGPKLSGTATGSKQLSDVLKGINAHRFLFCHILGCWFSRGRLLTRKHEERSKL